MWFLSRDSDQVYVQLAWQVDRHHSQLEQHSKAIVTVPDLREKVQELVDKMRSATPSTDFEKRVQDVEQTARKLGKDLQATSKGMASFHSDLEQLRSKQDSLVKALGSTSDTGPGLSTQLAAVVKNQSKSSKEMESLAARVKGFKSLLDSNGLQISAMDQRLKPLEGNDQKTLAKVTQHHANITQLQVSRTSWLSYFWFFKYERGYVNETLVLNRLQRIVISDACENN